MLRSFGLLRRFAWACVLGGGVVAIASCGSRTGLFGGDAIGALPDGGRLDGTLDAGLDGAVPCTPGRFTFDLAVAQLMFVIDRSGSMAFSLGGTQPDGGALPPGVESRWQVLRDGLFTAITPFANTLAMGAKFYPEEHDPGPNPPSVACRTDVGVAIAPALGNAQSIIDVFDTTSPNGGTPTAEAIRLGAQYLTGTRGVARTIVVATDGAPNCNEQLDRTRCTCTSTTGNCATSPGGEYNCLDDLRSISIIKDIFENQKIPVYVIGIGGTERPAFLKVLDDMALAGGRARATTPRHYNVQTSAEMKEALATISGSVAQCTYLTPSSPVDPNAITVEIDGRSIPRDPTRTNGWDWVDQAYGTLAFFGPACDAASGASPLGVPQISGVVRCENR